jgi:hypothetical protein
MLQTIFSALILSMSIESGFIPNWSSSIYQYKETADYVDNGNSYFMTTAQRFELYGVYVESAYTFYYGYRLGEGSGFPYRGSWDFEAGYKLPKLVKHLDFTIKYAHNCGHTIIPFDKKYWDEPPKSIDVGYDKISVTVTLSNQ